MPEHHRSPSEIKILKMPTVFISGGSRGIGRATVQAFLKEGWTVGFSYHASAEKAEELVRLGEGRCFAFSCDLASQEEVEGLCQAVLDQMGTPDVLVNNAGIAHYGLFQEVTPAEFDRLMQVNLKSAYFLSARLVPGMIRRGSGSIINLTSIWGETGASCEVLYSASKAAVIGFTKALAKELAPSGIRVNAISPGVVDTDMMASFSPEERDGIAQEIPLGRFASPDEIARTILFLSGDSAGYITGQILGVNGGYAM